MHVALADIYFAPCVFVIWKRLATTWNSAVSFSASYILTAPVLDDFLLNDKKWKT